MNIAHRHIIRIAAVLALSAASSAAFAQSAEYRRGYDAGYAAGQREAREVRDDRGERGPWGRLHIDEAEYGARGANCDARRGVHEQAIRNRGNIEVNNQLCGDPAPGEQKRLRLVYRCGDSAAARAFAREGERLRLNCGR
jgi:hypothetical protein